MSKTIDHHARAERLRALMGELTHVREDFEHANVDLDGEIPRVPCRFAASEYDGSENVINFFDSIEDAAASAADLGGECPWVPGAAVDLDTGNRYEPAVRVTYCPLRWAVRVSFNHSPGEVTVLRFESQAAGQGYIDNMRGNGNDVVTVLDDEPIVRWEEANDAA